MRPHGAAHWVKYACLTGVSLRFAIWVCSRWLTATFGWQEGVYLVGTCTNGVVFSYDPTMPVDLSGVRLNTEPHGRGGWLPNVNRQAMCDRMIGGEIVKALHLFIPFWTVLPAALLPTLVLWRKGRETASPFSCRHCDYCLTGNVSGICPECGEGI